MTPAVRSVSVPGVKLIKGELNNHTLRIPRDRKIFKGKRIAFINHLDSQKQPLGQLFLNNLTTARYGDVEGSDVKAMAYISFLFLLR